MFVSTLAETASEEGQYRYLYVAFTDPTMGMCAHFSDPGFCNTNVNMVHVKIDMTNPENQNPNPELEENEFIEVFSIPLKNLFAECKKLEGQGYAIDARVGTLAEGIEVARRWGL